MQVWSHHRVQVLLRGVYTERSECARNGSHADFAIALRAVRRALCKIRESRYNAFRKRGVAQVVARSVRDAEVDGSSPFAPTINKPYSDVRCGCENERRQPLVWLPLAFCHAKDRAALDNLWWAESAGEGNRSGTQPDALIAKTPRQVNRREI